VTTYATIDTTLLASPLSYMAWIQTSGTASRWGSGSQTPPSWATPAVGLSTTRRAISTCETASLYDRTTPSLM
jgi:hypothetical protein